MVATVTTSGSVLIKAGANVSTVMSSTGAEGLDAETIINQFINEGESYVNAETKFNWTDVYTTGLNADVKEILDETVSSHAAISCIRYDLDAIGRSSAMGMINVLWATIQRNISTLRNVEKSDFIKDA